MSKRTFISLVLTFVSFVIACYWFTMTSWIISLVISTASLLVLVEKPTAFLKMFTGYKQPRADKFRIDDLWVGPEGRTYKVKKGFGDHIVSLHPLSYNIPIYLREDSIKQFRRIKWGGQP